MLHDQLEALCAAHPDVHKLVFTPQRQFGQALGGAVAQQTGGWALLECTTLPAYAAALASLALEVEGKQLLQGGPTATLLAMQAIDQLPDAAKAHLLVDATEPATARAGEELVALVEQLRLEGITPEAFEGSVAHTNAERALAEAAAYSNYVQLLQAQNWADGAEVLKKATTLIETGQVDVGAPVVAVLDEVAVPKRIADLLDAVQAQARTFYRIGGSTQEAHGAPEGTAARRYKKTPSVPVAHHTNGHAVDVRCTAAIGRAEEVEAVFRDLLAQGLPLDTVEIAYGDPSRYPALIAATAERMATEEAPMPLSMSVGHPLQQTRPGQALIAWLEWISSGYDAATLIALLRGRLIRFDKYPGPRAASRLARLRYAPGRGGLLKSISNKIAQLEEELRELPPEDSKRVALQYHFDKWKKVQENVKALVNLVPTPPVTVSGLAEAAGTFIERFGPTRQPGAEPEERTLNEAARNRLISLLQGLADTSTQEYTVPRLADVLQQIVTRAHVQAEGPKPGKAYVVPLEQAGYSGRPHLFVVGLDQRSMEHLTEPTPTRIPQKAVNTPELKAARPSLAPSAESLSWQLAQVRRRHAQGTLQLYCRTCDVRKGEPCFASPTYLAWGDESAQKALENPVGPNARPQSRPTLYAADDWLAAYHAAGGALTAELLDEHYPLAASGRRAMVARAGEEWTPYDGLLFTDTPELAVLNSDTIFSSSRLELLIKAPYLYFVKYVLGVRELEEPALEDEPWIDRGRRGTLLHDTFERFWDACKNNGDPAEAFSPGGRQRLMKLLDERIAEEVEILAPPSEFVRINEREKLRADAGVFFEADPARSGEASPWKLELGFGLDGAEPVVLALADGRTLRLRGKIDRIDRAPDGTLHIWDYKTGSSSGFKEADGLQGGVVMQWLLYALAAKDRLSTRVSRAGYFFTSTAQQGRRIAYKPKGSPIEDGVETGEFYIETLADILSEASAMVAAGAFPMNPSAKNWGYGYERLRGDEDEEKRRIERKQAAWPEDVPRVRSKFAQKV